MSYTPPPGNAADLFLDGAYAAPAGDAVELNFVPLPDGSAVGILSGRLDDAAGLFSADVVTVSSGTISATLDDATGAFYGAVQSGLSGTISATLEDVAGAFSAALPPAALGTISATLDDAAGAFSAAYDFNTHRFITSSWNATEATMQPIAATVRSIQRAPAPSSGQAAVVASAALPIRSGVRSDLNQSAPLWFETKSTQQAGQALAQAANVDLAQLLPVAADICADTKETAGLSSATQAGFNLLAFNIFDLCGAADDAGKTHHTFTRSFYIEPDPAYTPSTDFDLGGVSQYSPIVVERIRYFPSSDLVFSEPMPADEQPVVLDFPGFNVPYYDYTFHIYDEPAAPYSPSTDFVLPYSSALVTVNDVEQIGGIRFSFAATWRQAGRLDVERCAPVDAARRPPPGTSVWIDPPRRPPVTPPEHVVFNIKTKTAYIMNHSLSVTLLDLTPIPMSAVRLSYDADAFAWQFSGQLADKAALPLVKQAAGQPPVQLIVTINGYSWKVLVERIGRGHEFGRNNITLNGHGLTALLGQPYQQPASATQGSALTVQQLAELHLPPDWSINWTAPTWLVPANAYSYSNQTPIQALASIAKDIGAMLVPARDSQTIAIMPRYPVLPWAFDQAEPDVTIPDAPIVAVNETTVAPSQANAVYVHGGEVGGVLAWCRLNGTAGDRLASSVSNALLTDVVGCRALGERILAGQYKQPGIQSITLPMDGVMIPLLSVSQLAEITVDGSPVRGIVNGVAIEATLASVRQTIQIGEETPNQWTLFKDLLPRDPLLVATLSSTDGSTAIMTLLDGGVVRVRGTGTVGNKYYIRAGKIDGEAPNMMENEVVI